jgi:hypothetical protein
MLQATINISYIKIRVSLKSRALYFNDILEKKIGKCREISQPQKSSYSLAEL